MKMIAENQTLQDAAKAFLACKKAQKIRDRTLKDYHKYINPFISMDIDVLRLEISSHNTYIPISMLQPCSGMNNQK